ncbi:MAG: hypothetical protein EOP45_13005 [Sphingobacteriaceae bacterium]|nr:MAG: hypothetical protein EOP45_13005 [Sphingobacteriaceae bacterium]
MPDENSSIPDQLSVKSYDVTENMTTSRKLIIGGLSWNILITGSHTCHADNISFGASTPFQIDMPCQVLINKKSFSIFNSEDIVNTNDIRKVRQVRSKFSHPSTYYQWRYHHPHINSLKYTPSSIYTLTVQQMKFKNQEKYFHSTIFSLLAEQHVYHNGQEFDVELLLSNLNDFKTTQVHILQQKAALPNVGNDRLYSEFSLDERYY